MNFLEVARCAKSRTSPGLLVYSLQMVSSEISKFQGDMRSEIAKCFCDALSKDFSDQQLIGLEFRVSREWDSVSHIRLMAALRDQFSIKLTFEDMVNMTTFKRVIEIISRHLGHQD